MKKVMPPTDNPEGVPRKNYVSIAITPENRDRLNRAREGGETWDNAISRWLDQGVICRIDDLPKKRKS